MKIPSAPYTVLVQTKSRDLFDGWSWVTRAAFDAESYSEANQIAAEEKGKWADPDHQIIIERNEEGGRDV
jgi:hypothetical protein